MLELKRHPLSRNDGISKVEVEVLRTPPAVLAVRYRVACPPSAVIVPAVSTPLRANRLWEHTCFEAFLRCSGTLYWEFNFAPSLQWAAYQFTDTRKGRVDLDIRPPLMESHRGDIAFEVRAAVDLSYVQGLSHYEPWDLGLSAVIEGGDKTLSYWALKHPDGPPDFHHRDAFAYTLPRA